MLLSVDSQIDLDAMLALAIANQPQSGYTVAEVGAGNGALTKQVGRLSRGIRLLAGLLLEYRMIAGDLALGHIFYAAGLPGTLKSSIYSACRPQMTAEDVKSFGMS